MFAKKLKHIALIFSLINVILYHIPFYKFVNQNTDISSLNGFLLLVSLSIVAVILNALVFYIGLYFLRTIGKYIIVLFFNINAIAIYFINTYGVIIDRSMIGNIFNTNYEESTSYLSISMLWYLVFLGILPSIYVLKTKLTRVSFKKFAVQTSLTLLFLLALAYANATNWLWIDKHSKQLGALAMPWSYVVNTARYYSKKNHENQKQIKLPDATIKNDKKSVMVLVIGESARAQNFSLLGYSKNTNPELSKMDNLHSFVANSCATYTTAGVKCIVSHSNSSKLYEILPNYLFRNNVEVIWRTTNWGEPTVKIDTYLEKDALKKLGNYHEDYDEILLNGLQKEILKSTKNKILIVLHTSTSHGPNYTKKYPERFNKFTPVCESVELSKCSQEELINAYDNTILYTDYILSKLINSLKELKEFNSSMIFVSDHGESLGENNLYMHGIPMSLAPEEQYKIPLIVWTSNQEKNITSQKILSQHHIFHSILNFLDIDSPIYDKKMSVFVN